MANKKVVSVLSTAAIGTLIATAVGSTVFAAVDGLVVKNAAGSYLNYDLDALKASVVNDALGQAGAELYKDFDAARTAGSIVSYHDDKVGFVDAAAVQKAALDSALAGTEFKLDTFTESSKETALPAAVYQAEVKDGKVVAGAEVKPVSDTATVSVQAVSAINAKSFKVVFNKAVGDTAKVTFTVKRSTTPVVVTATWNDAKTEATLTGGTNFPEGAYTVAVKNDTTDLGTSDVTVSQQKISKIEINSTKLAVTSTGKGYATYKVVDQYNNDITNSYVANGLNFQTGVGTITAKNGVLTVTPSSSMNLIQFAQVVITGYDSNTGVSVSATLQTSTALGTLSDISLGEIKNADGKVLTAGNTTDVFYVDYTATDVSGNPTKDYNLVKSGLILNSSDELSSSNSYVTAKVVQDPKDSTKAAIEVRVNSSASISMDMPVSVTAMTYTGKTSTLNTTLKKASQIDTFTLMAPSYDIAVNEAKVIPFEAFDQNGNKITKYSELKGIVSLSGNVAFGKNIDGTAYILFTAPATYGPQIITAMTPTGKISSLTINVQKTAIADSLALDSSVLINAMQAGATQLIDAGYFYGGLSVKDQYGRVIDMVGKPGNYKVVAEATTGSAVSVTGDAFKANAITVKADTAGAGTVIFKLIDNTNTSNPITIDQKSVTFSVLPNKDIKGYTIDAVTKPLYASAVAGFGTITDRDKEYKANPGIYGVTAGGSKVVLADTVITGVYVDNTNDFKVINPTTTSSAVSVDSVEVAAGKLTNNRTEASTNLTVTFIDVNGSVQSLTTAIKSTVAAPVASTIDAYADTTVAGLSKVGDTITVKLSEAAAGELAVGKYLTRFDENGSKANRSKIYLFAKDQYDKKAMPLAQVIKVDAESSLTDAEFDIDSNGKVIANSGIVAGDYVVITGVTTNGLVKTIKIVFN